MTKTKIAIIAGQLVVGGAERQLHLWLSNLDRTKFDPLVLTLHPGHGDYWEKPIEALGIPLIRIPQRVNPFRRLIEIVNALHAYQPRLIHGWHLFSSVYAGLAARILGVKSIAGVRNAYQSFNHNALESRLTLWISDTIIANSKTTADFIKGKVNSRWQSVYAVQNAVEENFIDRNEIRNMLSGKYKIQDDLIWIGSIGRLDPLKRFDLLLQVLSKLRDTGEQFHFILIGDGPERGKLERLIIDLGLSSYVTFTGEIPQAGRWLKAMDIFAFTSVDEGMPNVIMEAATAELPIVTWKLPFYEELLENEKNALLVDAEDTMAFTKAIIKLIEFPGLRNKIGQAAKKHMLTSFSLDHYIQNMTSVYESVLKTSFGLEKKDL